jgi:hypothetical protein
MSNNFISNHLTSNYLPDRIGSFEVERFDIKQREHREGQGREMDAVTSFELEARRRRETVASDRDQGRAFATTETERVEAKIVEPVIGRESSPSPLRDCQPAPLARQSAG